MNSLNVTNAWKNLYKLIEETASSHQPGKIAGKSANSVLVSEEYWEGINATLYLLSIPGIRESIRSGMQGPLKDCSTSLSGSMWTIHFASTARKDAKKITISGLKSNAENLLFKVHP